jgi:succinylglutamate desuccinylase
VKNLTCDLLNDLQKELQATGDFLKLSRDNEWSIPGAFSFTVTTGNHTTTVTVLDTGIITFEPECTTTNDIVLSCAVHGNETAPIEICADLVKKLILGELEAKQRVLFLFGNPASMNISERFVEENMNRLFSGAHSKASSGASVPQNKERTRAKLLEDNVRAFYEKGNQVSSKRERSHYDLHTAIRGSKNDKFAVYPFRHGQPWKKEQLQFLKQCGVSTILLSHSPTTTFSYFSSNEFGADAFTVELGKVMPFGQNDMTKFEAVKDTLTRFITGEKIDVPEYNADDFDVFEIYQTINRTEEDFRLNFADDVDNFTDFPKGYVLAFDGKKEVKVKQEGEAIIFPNADVAIGQRAMLTVTPTVID